MLFMFKNFTKIVNSLKSEICDLIFYDCRKEILFLYIGTPMCTSRITYPKNEPVIVIAMS